MYVRSHFGSSFKMARKKCLTCKKTGPPADPRGCICHPEVAKRQPAVKRQRVEPDPESGSSSDSSSDSSSTSSSEDAAGPAPVTPRLDLQQIELAALRRAKADLEGDVAALNAQVAQLVDDRAAAPVQLDKLKHVVLHFKTQAFSAEGQVQRLQNEGRHAADVALLRERALQGQVSAMEDTIAKLLAELRQAPAPLVSGWHLQP